MGHAAMMEHPDEFNRLLESGLLKPTLVSLEFTSIQDI
jgi:hypothetical protein